MRQPKQVHIAIIQYSEDEINWKNGRMFVYEDGAAAEERCEAGTSGDCTHPYWRMRYSEADYIRKSK